MGVTELTRPFAGRPRRRGVTCGQAGEDNRPVASEVVVPRPTRRAAHGLVGRGVRSVRVTMQCLGEALADKPDNLKEYIVNRGCLVDDLAKLRCRTGQVS